ncbi:MAG TPA: hypothetical protein VLF43_04770 [Candidatus Saccharimonadales bacterium]|nr:hypothetical protein [Candidatus Saccharimonadales bacterium]
MMRIKRFLVVGLSIATLLCSLGSLQAVASADASSDAAKNSACAGIGGTSSGGSCTTTGPSLNATLKIVINTLSVLIGVAAVVALMVGGLKYITSAGDSGKLGSAKNTIIFAMVGIAVVVLSQTIVHFVLHLTTATPK